MAEESDFLRCRFCDYKVLKFRRSKGGPARTNFPRLKNHIEDEHPDEFAKIYPGEAQVEPQ